jgi:hypothetical protein
MAARSHAARSTASRQRRRPAARRRPGARQGASRIHWDRVGRVALTLVLFAVIYSYLNPAIDFFKTYTGTTAARIKLHEVQRENTRLHWRIQHAEDPAVLDAKARAQGMVAPEEAPVIVNGL